MRLLAPLILAATLCAGISAQASETNPAQATTRPAPPPSAAIDVPLREAIGARAARRAPAPSAARRGGGRIGAPGSGGKHSSLFPETRVVTVYGAPQLAATIVGKKSARGAASEAQRLATRFGEVDPRATQPGIDLIATIATADRGPDGLFRSRQSPQLIGTYLDAVRGIGGRLVLDVQPGRAKFVREVKALEQWLLEPDVDIALDPEWNVGRRGVPGITEGKVTARQLNKVSAYLAGLVRERGLPQKGLYVHQFRDGSIRRRDEIAQRRTSVAVTLNFDGIGSPGPKAAGYRNLSRPRLFNGFSVFVSRDSDVLGFSRIAGLDPAPDYVMYQ